MSQWEKYIHDDDWIDWCEFFLKAILKQAENNQAKMYFEVRLWTTKLFMVHKFKNMVHKSICSSSVDHKIPNKNMLTDKPQIFVILGGCAAENAVLPKSSTRPRRFAPEPGTRPVPAHRSISLRPLDRRTAPVSFAFQAATPRLVQLQIE